METIGFGKTGLGGDYYGNVTTQSVASAATFTIPKGLYTVITDANGTLQMNVSGTWTPIAGAGTGCAVLYSEGTLFRVAAAATASTNVSLIPIENTNY